MKALSVILYSLASLTSLSNALIPPVELQQPLGAIPDVISAPKNRPNIVFILSDDQDLQLDSISYMPFLNRHLGKQGTFYKNHFVPTAICCPARVTLWTGRYAHNTNVTDVSPPYGGYPKFVERGFNSNFLPVWLQNAGYNTYYTGKLFNAHTVENYDSPHVAGFNGSDFLLDPFTYSYLNSTYQRNHEPPVSYEGRHTTDVITEKAFGLLDEALAANGPFFLGIAPVAPHSNVEPGFHGGDPASIKMTEPIPADRHKHLFKDSKVPRTEHFNPDTPSGVNWISRLPQQNQSNVDYNDHFYRSRLRALQGVDELVDQLVARLSAAGILDNTYIIYTSDNGYHIGQHRLQPGKECGFEEDIRVPLFMRGPGVAADHVEEAVTAHVDLVPTLFEIAGLKPGDDFDGVPLPLSTDSERARHEHANVEFWGIAIPEGKYRDLGPENPSVITNNTYKGLRIHGSGYDLYYSVWCNNVHELYDLTVDPYELNNIYPQNKFDTDNVRILGHPRSQVVNRLDAILLVLKSCKGVDCVKPWEVLHPGGDVQNLSDALNWKFDAFYHEQVKISYDRCEFGYLIDAEGPQVGLTYRDGLEWHHWV